MHTSLKILQIEDGSDLKETLMGVLRGAGFDPKWCLVQSEEQFLEHLETNPELILAGYNPTRFDALQALRHLRERDLDIPVIVVTGTVGEEKAVECMKQGAADYILEERLARLGGAVEQALNKRRLAAEKRMTDQALRNSIRQWLTTFDSIGDAIFLLDLEGNILRCNKGTEALLGMPSREIVGRRCWEVVHHTNCPIAECPIKGMLEPATRAAQTLPFGDKWINVVVDPMLDEKNNLVGYVHIISDVTELMSTQAALRKSEEKYRLLVEHANDAIFIVRDGAIKFANPMTEKLSGYSAEALHEKSFSDFIHPDDKERTSDWYGQRIIDPAGPQSHLFRIVRQDGRTLWCRLSVAEIVWEDRPASLNVVRDVTEEKKLEEQFHQSQKMEAIGRLAGGIAHDFNNILTVILGIAELLPERMSGPPDAFEDVREIRKAAGKAANLTRQLLAFSRKQVFDTKRVDLNDNIRELDKMLRRLLGEDLEVEIVLAAGLEQVEVDPVQMEQVIVNLAVNARDAMPEGGRLTIETRNVFLSNDFLDLRTAVKPGPYVLLSVSDTGRGMDEETRLRIFEPFFTTKIQDRGTGLGLAMVYGIVKQLGGYILVYSEIGLGTTFNIYLPAAEDKGQIPNPAPPETVKAEPARILLVEDELMLQKLFKRVLEMAGHEVTAFQDPKAALLAVKKEPPYSLVVSDVILPGISGPELVEQIKARSPETKTLFISGYTEHVTLRSLRQAVGEEFLQKPFTTAELTNKVNQILSGEKQRN